MYSRKSSMEEGLQFYKRSLRLLLIVVLFAMVDIKADAAASYLLDTYPGAYLAVAPFTLSSTYTGPLLRVECSSDSVQADIMPDSSGCLSLASEVTNRSDAGPATALADFAGTDTIYAMVFYDQSGYENDLYVPSAAQARIIMEDGSLSMDSYGNPSLWVDPAIAATYGKRGFEVKQLHAPFSIGNFTAITLMEPYYITSGTNPDQSPFNFGPLVHTPGANKHFYFRVDGNNKRTQYFLGNGLDTNSYIYGASYLLDYPTTYIVSASGTTIESQTNRFQYRTVINPYTPPSTDWVQPFAGNDGQSSPLLDHASGFILYPEYKDQTTRDAIVDLLSDWYSSMELVGVNESAILPQYKQDYITLYDWLETLSEGNFDIPQDASTAITYMPVGATVRDLFGTYQAFLNSIVPRTDLLRYPASAFVLDNGAGEGIEGDGANVRVVRSLDGNEGVNLESAFFYTFTQPGVSNPYYQHPGLANRLVSQAFAMMMEIDHQLYFGSSWGYPEYTGMDVMQSLTAFEAAKDGAVGITDAHKEAFYRIVHSIMNYWDQGFGGPKDANTNMDTKAFYGLALLYKGATEQDMTDIATNARELAAKYLLGSRDSTNAGDANGEIDHVIFHSAGYIGERSIPETSYNGISLYYLAKAAAVVDGVPGWEWLWDTDGIVDRMAKFKSYQIFRDPDGRFNGPSGYAVRTNDPYAEDQSASEGRDYIVAQLSDHGIEHYWKRTSSLDLTKFTNPSQSTVDNAIQNRLNASYGAGMFAPAVANYEIINHGDERWWAHRVTTIAHDYYNHTFYDRLMDLLNTSSPTLQLPSLRVGTQYNEAFGRDGHQPEFWSFKDVDVAGREFAAFLESYTRNPLAYNGYNSWFGGGTIQSFWTEDGGLVINSRTSQDGSAPTGWPAVGTWATHHLWGTFADDTAFSSAQRQTRITDYIYDDIVNPSQFTATNIPDRETGSYLGDVTYERTIKKIQNGLEVTTSLSSGGQDAFKTLWESIPIYLSYNKTTNALTSVEYTTDVLDGEPYTWPPLSTTSVPSITAVRLGRDHGTGPAYVYIVPESPQSIQLAPEWQADYQQADYFQQLMIDLHPNSGTEQAIASADVTYIISTIIPTVTLVPTASLTAIPTSITERESSTLTWSSTNADTCMGTNFSTGGATNGSVMISPTVDTTYTVNCHGAADSVTVMVIPAGPVQHTVTAVAGKGGSHDPATPSPRIVNDGAGIAFTFHADSKYHITSITGCGCSYVNTDRSVTSRTETTGPVSGDCTVTATFQYTFPWPMFLPAIENGKR